MTARNMQDKVKKKGLPWSAAKGFDTFNPVSSFIEKSKIADPHNVNVWLKVRLPLARGCTSGRRILTPSFSLTSQVNGQMKQNGNTKDMIFNIPQLIEHVSSIMTLEEGDLILTGE